MSIVVKGKKGMGSEPREVARFVIGSRSTANLTVDDPTVAERHCAIHDMGAGYEIEDLGSSTGTYLDGVEVRGRVALPPAGARIVLGHSRLQAEIDAASGDLVLTLKEGAFFFDRKSDPLEWVRSEVTLGRWPLLRRGIVATTLIMAALCAWLALGPGASAALQPGALATVHAEAVAKLSPTGDCAACHAAWKGTQASLCDTCHKKKMADGTRYPFWTAAEWADHGRACAECHLEHQGEGEGLLVPPPAQWKRVWSDGVAGTPGPRAGPALPATVDVRLTFNTFSHQQHLKQKLACSACHRGSEQPLPASAQGITRDFTPLSFEGCMTCHDPSLPESKAKIRFHVAWHGTGEKGSNCRGCHTEDHVATLRRVVREVAPARSWSYRSRSHRAELELMARRAHPAVPAGRACTDCHHQEAAGGAERSGPFRHGTHVSLLDPTCAKQCADCHAEVRKAEHLAPARPALPPETGCKACHDQTVPTRVPGGEAGSREAIDFPHAVHLGSRHALLGPESCFACHAFEQRGADAYGAAATTLKDAATCLLCHKNHEHVGLDLARGAARDSKGDCVRCHRPGDPAWWGERGNPEKPVVKRRPWNGTFSHFSRGHSEATEKDCSSCHAGTERAGDLLSVPIPDENLETCRACHRRTRFHWR